MDESSWFITGSGELLQCIGYEGSHEITEVVHLRSIDGALETFDVEGLGSFIGRWSKRIVTEVPECTGWDWVKPDDKEASSEALLYWVRYEDQRYEVLVRGVKEDIACSSIRKATWEDFQFGNPL